MIAKSNEICRNLIGSRFFRVDPELKEDLALGKNGSTPTRAECRERSEPSLTGWVLDKPELLLEMVKTGNEVNLSACFAWLEDILEPKHIERNDASSP